MAEYRSLVIRLTPAQHERLRRLAFEQRVSINELIRRAIDETYGADEAEEQGKAA